MAEKRTRTERSESEMDTEGGGEGTEGGGKGRQTQCQSRYKKGHMMNVYLKDSDEEAIVDFVKDQKEPERFACAKELQAA